MAQTDYKRGETRRSAKIDLGGFAKVLAIVISSLSIANLIRIGVTTGDLAIPVRALLDAYHQALALIFNPIEPHISAAIHEFADKLGLSVRLLPHWRHIFLISAVGWLSAVRIVGRTGNAPWTMIWCVVGFSAALATAMFAGILPLGIGDPRAEWLIFLVPFATLGIAGVLVLLTPTFLPTRWRFGSLFIAVAIVGVLFIIATGMNEMPPGDNIFGMTVLSPGLLLYGLFMFSLSVLQIIGGAIEGLFERYGAPWRTRIWRDPAFRIGLEMAVGFTGALLLFAASAGLNLLES